MTEVRLEKLKYPMGRFSDYPHTLDLDKCISKIARFPDQLSNLVKDLSSAELGMIYRPGGWSIKQVVHHLADSHMNSLLRHKLTLTEQEPIIKTYEEEKWVLLADGSHDDLTDSLLLLKAMHNKWVQLLEDMSEDDFDQSYVHPGKGKKITLHTNTALYAWHGEHHIAHINQALKFKGVFE